MNWMNNLFYMIILTTISGSVVFALWLLWEKIIEQSQLIKCAYPLLLVVAVFFCAPFVYIVLVMRTINFEKGISQGELFVDTPFFILIQCIAAILWIIGAVIYIRNYIKEYLKFHTIMKKNIVVNDLCILEQKDNVQKDIGISKDVKIAINYSVRVPFVYGLFQKTIVLPVHKYTDKQREIVLYHEMMHIKQHILTIKQLMNFLKMIQWFNPLILFFFDKIDEWSETECDLMVLAQKNISFTAKEYFEVALAEVEASNDWMSQLTTQLQKEKNLFKRVNRMKKIKKETKLRAWCGMIISIIFLFVSGTSVYAMGQGFVEVYERVYEATVVEEEVETVQPELVEELYVEEEIAEIEEEGIVLYDGSISINWNVPANTLLKSGSISMLKGDVVTISVYTEPAEKSLRVGLLTPYGTKWYANGVGGATFTAELTVSGEYRVFVENTDSVAFTAKGSAVYY